MSRFKKHTASDVRNKNTAEFGENYAGQKEEPGRSKPRNHGAEKSGRTRFSREDNPHGSKPRRRGATEFSDRSKQRKVGQDDIQARNRDTDKSSENRPGSRYEKSGLKPRHRVYNDLNDRQTDRKTGRDAPKARSRSSAAFTDKNTIGNNGPGSSKSPQRPARGFGKPAHRPAPKNDSHGNADEDTIRLNKFIAHAGICSRREADTLIKAGVITVNGEVVSEVGTKIKLTDHVKMDGAQLKTEKKVYVLLNKPKNYITTVDDPRKRKTVMNLVAGATRERIYPVGRLDRNTTGLLLFTNDGDLAKKLTHPASGCRKTYHVVLDRNVSKKDLDAIETGLELEDGIARADEVQFVEGAGHSEVGITLHIGKNRIVRRLFEHLGYQVIKLDRVTFGGLTKKDLPRGKYRHLTELELTNLRKLRG